jgi:quinol-cytochrome oxidoreductase complex cytochrome b subunit
VNPAGIWTRNRTARWLTEVFQPPVVVTVQLLISPVVEAGFPGTIGYGALAALFVCVLPLFVLLGLVRLGKVTDHHVSNRKQRAPVLLMALGSVVAGLVVLQAIGAPRSVLVMVLAIVAGIIVLAAVSQPSVGRGWCSVHTHWRRWSPDRCLAGW